MGHWGHFVALCGELSHAANSRKLTQITHNPGMPAASSVAGAIDALPMLRRLVRVRWIAIALVALLAAAAPVLLGIPLPRWPLFAVITVTAALNAVVHLRLRAAASAAPGELLSQLLVDIAALSALVFFSGGATNPLVSLLLPPVAIAALALPARGVAVVAGAAITAYSLLMLFYVPLPLDDANRAARLHLLGMWLTFALSTALIAWFVVRMTTLIRARDAELATAREQALRDERVMAIGTLAAGAAHELGTPLATMALLAGELAEDTALPEPARKDAALMRTQIAACKEIITGLSRRAGAERLENPALLPADRWLDALRQRWHALRPAAASSLAVANALPAPRLLADPRLEQAVLNLLNNAASASDQPIEILLGWSDGRISIDVRDHGPGFPEAVLSQGGSVPFPAHESGSGIGLMLTRVAVEQTGGRLLLENPPGGGARAHLDIPARA